MWTYCLNRENKDKRQAITASEREKRTGAEATVGSHLLSARSVLASVICAVLGV